MKKISTIILLLFTTLTQAQSLTAGSLGDLLKAIDSEDFTYKETGKLFGYISTSSCLHVSENMAIFKNYCFPVRDYPARGYTIISKEFGMVDVYEEKLPNRLKREFNITQFPEILLPYLSTPFPNMTLSGLSAMIEKMYYQYNPGCWSTNYSFYTDTEDANCNVDTAYVNGFDLWASETQEIVADEKAWNAILKKIDSKLK